MRTETPTLAAVVTAAAIVASPHGHALIPVSNSELRPSEAVLHHEHLEVEAADMTLVARAEREARPAQQMPFGNGLMSPNPMEMPRQPLGFVQGPSLALLTGYGESEAGLPVSNGQ